MTDADLCYTSATDLTVLIANGDLSPVELMRSTIDRIESLNSTLNAICTPTLEQAMDAARSAEAAIATNQPLGPLHGIPTTIKDLVFTRGVRTMMGSHIFADRVPDVDAVVVTRLNEAGAISLGKTTVPEFGWKGCSDSPLTGVSHNPWKHGMNAGGSSTGAAICAAAGIGPLHQGSDGAGSIRMPAAFCGVYGLKPSYGRVPSHPVGNNDQISHIGPITRTVTDAALMLNVMAGPDDRDPSSADERSVDYLADLNNGVAGWRVAYSPDLGYLPVDKEVAESVAKAAKTFEGLGAHVQEVDPGWGDPIDMEHFFWTANFAGNLGPHLEQWEEKMDPGLVLCIRDGADHLASDYVQMKQRRLDYHARVLEFFENYDLLLTPSLSVAAFPVERLIPEHWEQHPWDWLRWAGFSYPFNLTWLPAATCPSGFTRDGLPVGLQIVGGHRQDKKVLQASRAFETAQPWAQRRPIE
jgi:aspartyl-tRNA(Asn)/glutamyl-tRNA(Gln) amidotransferase subunit A